MHVSSLLLIKYSPVQPAPNRRSVRCLCPCTRPRCAPARLENSSMEYRDCDVRWQPRADTHALLRWARMPLSKRHSCKCHKKAMPTAASTSTSVSYQQYDTLLGLRTKRAIQRHPCKILCSTVSAWTFWCWARLQPDAQSGLPVTTLGLQGWCARLYDETRLQMSQKSHAHSGFHQHV